MSAEGGLKGSIPAFIADESAGRFEDLALKVFRHQWEGCAPYRRLCEDRGIEPDAVRHWREIPAVSTVAFKSLRLACGPTTVVFRTSGTTHGKDRRGEHHLADTDLYQAALRRQFRKYVLPDAGRMRMLVITPSPDWAPDSSLGFMMEDVVRQYGAPGSGFFLGPDGLRREALLTALDESAGAGIPVALLGVTLGFVHLLEHLDAAGRAFHLAPGSRVMDTGGFKGERREVARAAFLEACRSRLGIEPRMVVNEYGMTELSSQFYDASLLGGDPGVKLAPHWVRTRIIDPESGEEATPGDPGLLRHVDLANLDSVLAVDTEDLGRARGGGFELMGRLSGATPRGCSISVDDLLSRGESDGRDARAGK